jgi:hypothetical protein
VKEALLSTPRPEPGHVLPAVAGTGVVVLALPVFLMAGWSLAGWGLAAILWVAVHGLNALLARLKRRRANLAGSGVQAFGLFFKAIAILVVLLAAVGSDPGLALAAALTYALAYTLELGLSLLAYFGNTA